MEDRQRKRAWMTMMRHAYLQAGDDELVALHAEYHDEWALLQGDMMAGDYAANWDAAPTLEAQIAYCEWHMKEIERAMERRLRAGVKRMDTSTPEQWQARFDAMRRRSLVEGLRILGIPLEKKGKEWKAACPFHNDDTPSFSVNDQKNLWTCYSCQRGGDLVELVTLLYGKSRGEALTWLEKISGTIEAGSLDRPQETYDVESAA